MDDRDERKVDVRSSGADREDERDQWRHKGDAARIGLDDARGDLYQPVDAPSGLHRGRRGDDGDDDEEGVDRRGPGIELETEHQDGGAGRSPQTEADTPHPDAEENGSQDDDCLENNRYRVHDGLLLAALRSGWSQNRTSQIILTRSFGRQT